MELLENENVATDVVEQRQPLQRFYILPSLPRWGRYLSHSHILTSVLSNPIVSFQIRNTLAQIIQYYERKEKHAA